MVGLVLVSHSAALVEGLRDLVAQMESEVPLAIATDSATRSSSGTTRGTATLGFEDQTSSRSCSRPPLHPGA